MGTLAVHLGPGPLGLGLVVDVLLRQGFDVCLIGKPEGKEHKEYWLAFADPDRGLQSRQVQWACNPRDVQGLGDDVTVRLRTDSSVLITCALGDKAAERDSLLREILALRPAGAETVLLACENEPDEIYAAIAQGFPDVYYCACVVDRICSRDKPEIDSEGRRRLLVHSVAQWVIRQPQGRPHHVIEQLADADEVVATDQPLDAHKARKLWVVNGVHLLLALLARKEGLEELPLDDARRAAFEQLAQPLIESILEAVERRWPDLRRDPEFAADRVRAFCESPDSASRILRHRLIRSDLTSLMARLDTRLGSAARLATEEDVDTYWFEALVDVLLETLRDRNAYLAEPSGAHPTAEKDEDAVELFEQFMAGWTNPERAERAARELRALLAIQRL